MIKNGSKQAVLVLAVGLITFWGICEAQIATPRLPIGQRPIAQNAPVQSQGGVTALLSAKSSLEKAGDRWGGHRVKAIHLIDEALRAAGRPQTESHSEMKSGPQDEPAALESGISSLQSAKSSFRGGQVVSLIDQALRELQSGIEYAKAHHTY
jgi:hypothetical protein